MFEILSFFNFSQSYCLLSEGLTLSADEIVSSHTVKPGDVLIECYEFCMKEPKIKREIVRLLTRAIYIIALYDPSFTVANGLYYYRQTSDP